MIALLLVACTGGEAVRWEAATVAVSAPDGVFVDPKLGGDPAVALVVDADPTSLACTVTTVVSNEAGQVWEEAAEISEVATLEVSWNGLDGDGVFFDPGPARVVATLACDDGARTAAETWLGVVRVGVVAVDLQSHPDDLGNRAVAYRKLALGQAGVTLLDEDTVEYQVVPGVAGLDEDDGSRRPSVEPWTNPDMPPWGTGEPGEAAQNLPAAYLAGSRVRVVATLGSTAVSALTGQARDPLGGQALEVRILADGLEAAGDDALAPGDAATFDSAPLDATTGREELAVTWRFEVRGDDGWEPVAGRQVTRHRIYRLAGEPALLDGTADGAAPPYPWIGVLDDTADALDGVAAEPAAVLDALRSYLYDNDYLVYDPSDSAYTDYEGPYVYWESISADLSGWLDRAEGVELYCHSVSCMLSTLAGHVGVDAPQQVLGVGFDTNLTRAAGSDTWRHWSFTSHSVVSPDDGATIWDASVDLDGDSDPSDEPVEPLSASGLDHDEYLWRLTADPDVDIVNSGLCYFY